MLLLTVDPRHLTDQFLLSQAPHSLITTILRSPSPLAPRAPAAPPLLKLVRSQVENHPSQPHHAHKQKIKKIT